MASKINWIAFILYISFYTSESFSTTSEPSSESSYLTSLSTGSTNNASDITNTSILSQQNSSPSPEAPRRLEDTSHISEEFSTRLPLRTTITPDHEDLDRDEFPGSRLSTASSLSGETSTTVQLEGNSTTDVPVSNKQLRLPHLQHIPDKLSYAKPSHSKKKVLSKNSQHFSDKLVTSSLGNSVIKNETNEFLVSSQQNESYLSSQTQSYSESLVESEVSQALDEQLDIKRAENNAALERNKSSRTNEMILQSVTVREEESKAGKHSGTVTDPHFKSDVEENALDTSGEMKNESSVSSLLQESEVKGNDSDESVTENNFIPIDEHTNFNENSTHLLSSDIVLLNFSSASHSASAEEKSSIKSHISHSKKYRKRRSSNHFIASAELPGNYMTTSPSDESSHVQPTLSTESNAENLSNRTLTEAESGKGSVNMTDGKTVPGANTDIPSKENVAGTLFVTTLHSTEYTSVSGQNSPAINSKSQKISNFSSEVNGLSVLEKEVSQSESSATSTEEVMSEATALQKFNGEGKISNISVGDSVAKAFTEKASISENTVVSAVPLCKDDEEIDVESTSEISIKVFPLCEKQEAPKEVISVSPSDRSTVKTETPTSNSIHNPSTELQNDTASRSESPLEDSHDSLKTVDLIHEGPEAGEHSKNLTTPYKSSTPLTESTTKTLQDGNTEQENLPTSSSHMTSVNMELNEDIVPAVNESKTEIRTETSNALNTESHRNLNDLMEIHFTEVREGDQSMNNQLTITQSDINENAEEYENQSSVVNNVDQKSTNQTNKNSPTVISSHHETLKGTVNNSSDSSPDYMADQSEVLPVISYPPSQNTSFIEHFTSRKEIKIIQDTESTVANNTKDSGKTEFPPIKESFVSDVITLLENPVATDVPEQNISSPSLSDVTIIENYTTLISSEEGQNHDINIKENSTNSETKIAGVGVKTTVSVSLNVTKMNHTEMDNKSENHHLLSPVVTSLNETSNNQKLPGNFSKTETAYDAGSVDSSKSPNASSIGSSISTEGTPSPQPSTTRRSFAIRKPRIRINGEGSESPVSRKPFFVKSPPTRPSEVIAPVGIFQKNRTRLGSITSSTTVSTTLRTSWRPFVGQPMTWKYGFENFTFVPEVETVPTTTEVEVQDADIETVSFSTLSQHETVRYKVPASILVRKGINCLPEHFKNKYSPEYRSRKRLVLKMLRALYYETEIRPRIVDIEIESIYCRKSKNITVDYNLYLSKGGSEFQKDQLVKIFNNKLENSTFQEWVLDPSATSFEEAIRESITTPAPQTEDVEPPIPQWAIAVIVIGAASLIFIILFGALTVYGRHHMRRRYNGSRLGDDDVDRAIDSREWDDKMAATYENLAADGIYDIDDGGFDSVKRPYRD